MSLIRKVTSIILINLFMLGSVYAAEVNVYTSRHYDSDDALYQKFTDSTGIKVNVISGKGKALMERLASEGANSPADVFITVDAGNLHDAKLKNISQKIDSKLLNQLVPKNLRDADGHWVWSVGKIKSHYV